MFSFCTPSAIGGYPQTSGIEWTLDTTVEYDQGELYHNADGSDTSYYAPASIKRVTITAINGEPFDPASGGNALSYRLLQGLVSELSYEPIPEDVYHNHVHIVLR